MPFSSYAVPISCKGIVIEDDQVWLRHNERGEWELPGGKLDNGEQPEATVAREVSEELGILADTKQLLTAYITSIPGNPDEADGVLVLIYLCEFIERVGEPEHDGEGGPALFKKFQAAELNTLNIDRRFKEAILEVIK